MPTATSIIDNRNGNTLQVGIENITDGSRTLSIATAFFSLDALAIVACNLRDCESVRILFGDEADKMQRSKLLERLREQSDADLADRRLTDPTLSNLGVVNELFKQKRIQARCYTSKKFHAKAYLADRVHYPNKMGILGSGNFTGPGLTRNIELNVELTPEQTGALAEWYEERWNEAVEDDVTGVIQQEIKRQIELYEPYDIYQRALLAWGDWIQGRDALPELTVVGVLDPHQEDAYRQALKIVAREHGVLISDGVGLGKSFVALALMEHFLARGKRAFLIAPKAILSASWEGYLTKYLDRYRRGYSSLAHEPMTWFGYDPKRADFATSTKIAELNEYATQAEVIVIDESHNFRKTDANRYVNLLKMLQEGPLGPKMVILLTATPINTEYRDLAAQFRLITREKGHIGGVRIEQYQRAAVTLDYERDKKSAPQLELELETNLHPKGLLKQGLQTIAIQRSRRTCKEIAAAHGKLLRFPEREPIRTVEYTLSPLYTDVVRHARQEFEELATFLKTYRAEVSRAAQTEGKDRKLKVRLPERGLRFSAYLPDRYRKHPDESLREAQVESFLVSLVFVNVMKQLESSPAAFQGIVQALGAGLCARLRHMADRRELPADEVAAVVSHHAGWIGRDVFTVDEEEDESPEGDDDAVASDASGEQMDDWLVRALRLNNVRKGLEKFGHTTHDVASWRKHIETDIMILQGIHERLVRAREVSVDCKLRDVTEHVRSQRAMDRKILLFTQSRRTAEYLEREFKGVFGTEVARIDAGVQGDRRTRILHSFSPKYNPMDQPPLDFTPVNILISTDVLAEGVNLQEAGCILNYDIHWNPVRLIQRIGRVDRRLREDDPGHTFAILNVHPPESIEDIIDLVGTVENRKRKITNLLGLDQSFFSATDPEGTLQEFNAQLEGEVTARDVALNAYDTLVKQHPKDLAAIEAMPPGALGVWNEAPHNGVVALFQVAWRRPEHGDIRWKPEDTIPESDLRRFAMLIGSPQFAMSGPENTLTTDASTILELLAGTTPGEKSGMPQDVNALKTGLKRLRTAVLSSIPDRTQNVTVDLVCWMELRTA